MSAPAFVAASGAVSGGASPDTGGTWSEVHAVFCNQSGIPWLHLLKPGFRHCFVALGNGAAWVTIDPLSCWTDVEIQPVPGDFDLPGWYRSQGMRTLSTTMARTALPRPAPFAPFTCVEAVKRVLGVTDRWVLTPYQLYRRIAGPDPDSDPDLAPVAVPEPDYFAPKPRYR